MKTWDVFISHASEDKESIVEPLVQTLKENGILCWYDKDNIDWGDSLIDSINNGLKNSRYVIVILSENFIKGFAKAELNSMLSMEYLNGQKKVLPLIVGNEQVCIDELPLLRDKKYIVWNKKSSIVIYELKKVLEIEVKPYKLTKNKNYSINKNYFIALGLIIIVGSFLLDNSSFKYVESKESNPAITVLAKELTKQAKEKEYWKQQYYELKEKYKDYPNLITTAKTIQESEGYHKAVKFFMKIDLDNHNKKISLPTMLQDNTLKIKPNISNKIQKSINQSNEIQKEKDELNSDDIKGIWNLKKYILNISDNGYLSIYKYINHKNCYRQYYNDKNYQFIDMNNDGTFYLRKENNLLSTSIIKINDIELEISSVNNSYSLEKEDLELSFIKDNSCR